MRQYKLAWGSGVGLEYYIPVRYMSKFDSLYKHSNLKGYLSLAGKDRYQGFAFKIKIL